MLGHEPDVAVFEPGDNEEIVARRGRGLACSRPLGPSDGIVMTVLIFDVSGDVYSEGVNEVEVGSVA